MKTKSKQPSQKQEGKKKIRVEFPCTTCDGDATIGYSASKGANWGGKVKVGERLCTNCFHKRGGTRFL